MKRMTNVCVAVFLFMPVLLHAQEGKAEDDEAIHNELRALRDKMKSALKQWTLDQLGENLQYFHENVVFTPMNAEVCRGHDQMRAYFNKMLSGAERIVESVSIDFTVDSLTILYGDDTGGKDTGVAYGDSLGHYKLTNGLQFDVQNKWTSTLVKEEGAWKIASLHACANMFDNPLLKNAERSLYWVGGVAAVIGLILGVILTRVFKRRKS